MGERLKHFEHVHATNHFLEFPESQLRHDLAHLLRDELHEIHQIFGLP